MNTIQDGIELAQASTHEINLVGSGLFHILGLLAHASMPHLQQSDHLGLELKSPIGEAGPLSLGYDVASGFLNSLDMGVISESLSYNAFGELDQISAISSSAPLFQESVTRDKLGRIAEMQETVQGDSHIYDYSYDSTGRLTAVTKDGMTTSVYNYDANNNRISATVNNQNVSATYDAQDRMLTYGTRSYTYTPNGEVASVYDSSNQSTWTYDYDVFGELKDANNNAGLKITYLYDGEHNRVASEINGGIEKRFVYNEDGRLIGEYNAKGVLSEFVYASQSYSPDFMLKGSNKYYFVKDHLGSIRLVVDYSTGQVMQRLDYDEFGNVTNDTNPGFQPFGFAGGLFNSQAGLVHFGARDYDPSTGRWMQKDPIRFDGGQANLYVYVHNNPVNLVDPSGLWTFSAGFSFNISIGHFHASGSVGVVVDGHGNGGVYVSGQYGGTSSAGDSEGAGLSVQVSNADNISDLRGPFAASTVSGGDGLGGTIDTFSGYTSDGREINGSGITFGEQEGASLTIGKSYTNIYQLWGHRNQCQ